MKNYLITFAIGLIIFPTIDAGCWRDKIVPDEARENDQIKSIITMIFSQPNRHKLESAIALIRTFSFEQLLKTALQILEGFKHKHDPMLTLLLCRFYVKGFINSIEPIEFLKKIWPVDEISKQLKDLSKKFNQKRKTEELRQALIAFVDTLIPPYHFEQQQAVIDSLAKQNEDDVLLIQKLKNIVAAAVATNCSGNHIPKQISARALVGPLITYLEYVNKHEHAEKTKLFEELSKHLYAEKTWLEELPIEKTWLKELPMTIM